jgi:hypothetical protein
MRGLEPPPSYLDTDLNRGHRRHMCPWASRLSVLLGFADAWDVSDDMTVAKLLSRGCGPRRATSAPLRLGTRDGRGVSAASLPWALGEYGTAPVGATGHYLAGFTAKKLAK